MSEQLFDIYFKGEALEGFPIAQVQQNVARLFKASPEKTQQLFSGKVLALKKNLDKTTAIQFQSALKKAGAKIYIKPAQTPPEKAPAKETAEKATTATDQSSASVKQTPGFNILPVGSDILTQAEKPPIDAANIDTSNIHIVSAFDTPEPQEKIAPPAPDVSHISAAPAGSDVLEGVTKIAPPAAPDTSHIHLGSIGELAEEIFATDVELTLPAPDISGIQLAEVGADIDPSEKKTPPPAPNTQHIQLSP
ncbi:MAG: hypothetical protein HRU20_25835 [Pseudomonadales bacterium]|nr:hypothetical protein [Pseudomonadales bacterium]